MAGATEHSAALPTGNCSACLASSLFRPLRPAIWRPVAWPAEAGPSIDIGGTKKARLHCLPSPP